MKSNKIIRIIICAVMTMSCILLAGCTEERKTSLQLAPDGIVGAAGADAQAGTPGDAGRNSENADQAGNVQEAADQQNDNAAPAPNPAETLNPEQQDETADSPAPAKPAAKYTSADYEAAGVNELNSVPILMYHRIYNLTNDETDYTGGNVDADGYNRTYEAFAADLQMYYDMGYRCMRLSDYVDGYIDVPFGYAPVILTFDDGIRDVVVEGYEDDGTPIFDPTCAIGVLENFKKSHPDFNTTATFFVNSFLFEEIETKEENGRVMNWMIDNGYDIGNHTMDHPLLEDCTQDEIIYEVGGVYKILDEIIPGRYVNIVALPFGSPTSMEGDSKYDSIFSGTYEGTNYTSRAALLCGWTRAYSPFVTEWDITCIRRIRGYDNNGEDFDIEFNFEQLNAGKRYISDGDPDTVVIRADEEEDWLADTRGKQVIRY